jgi:hypothetical protein
MSAQEFESASGVRPAMLYAGMAVVLTAVAARAWAIATDPEHHQPRGGAHEERLPTPDFDLVDRDGRFLALSVQRMDLRLSPRAMWQAHTPRRIARALLQHLEPGTTEASLLQDLLPSMEGGVVRVTDEAWRLDYEAATRVERWAHELGIEEHLWLERDPERAAWSLAWRPVELLDEPVRLAQGDDPRDPLSPLAWTRRLADGLLEAIRPRPAGAPTPGWDELTRRRRAVWAELLPDADVVAVRGLPPGSVERVLEVLDEEGVQRHQMSVEFEHQRLYPTRDGSPTAEAAFGVVGEWRYVGRPEAQRLADLEGGTVSERTRRARRMLDDKHPRVGLEGEAAALLRRPELAFVRPEGASYSYRRVVSARQPARRYYTGEAAEGETPTVVSSLDGDLQRYLQEELDDALAEHEAAVVEAVVVDVATGGVLAVGGVAREEVSEFLPTWHEFTPGSTFKAVVMAVALEAGVVHHDEDFDTHDGNYRVPGSRRTIHEARGAPTGWIPAWMGLSRSVNAVLVQIGMRVDDDYFLDRLHRLGYEARSGVTLGVESPGSLPDLPWKPAYSHASVSFGHEVTVNLWQHAAALATILRGGTHRPLRILEGVEWQGSFYPVEPGGGDVVFSKATCDDVRRMMERGALDGTGRHLSRAEAELGTPLRLLSKTGTTEKEVNAPCLHLELERNAHNAHLPLGRKDPGFMSFEAMKARPKPHRRSCYTSSICLVGSVPGEDREVLVLFVVDEPIGKAKFGSDVAGPSAMRVLKEALGLTEGGVPVRERAEWAPDYGYGAAPEGNYQPWRDPALRGEDDGALDVVEEERW